MEGGYAAISTSVSNGQDSRRAVSTDKGSENEENSFHINFLVVFAFAMVLLYTIRQKRQRLN
jgi:hypothetical protein